MEATKRTYNAMIKFTSGEPLTDAELHDLSSLLRIDENRGYEPGNVRWAQNETEQRDNLRYLQILNMPLGNA